MQIAAVKKESGKVNAYNKQEKLSYMLKLIADN
jgi:hypothetical protein